ncbi:glycosyltransferase family 2 protein [Acidisoma sp.]|uniref:glycosyltransferase family 2 protein n=1 Tax=Acidisoma sp. TaxID=1872115 RepID=UPI003B00F1D0
MTLNIVIGIPTVGRAPILRETLRALALQTRQADRVLVCGTKEGDVTGAADIGATEVLLAKPGLPAQRNALIAAAPDADIMLFFDDDFLPDPHYLAAIEKHMTDDPATVVATGLVLQDGIGGPGLAITEAKESLRAPRPARADITPVFSGYGCNMAVRLTTMRQHGLLFDERLPLYGWQEDVDLSRRLAAFGNVVKVNAAFGIHLGVKQGRNSGVRLGYSQVANPLYLAGKRSGYPVLRALEHIGRNVAMNIVHAPRPEPYVDRRGRLRGNLLAMADLIRKRMAPERVLEL